MYALLATTDQSATCLLSYLFTQWAQASKHVYLYLYLYKYILQASRTYLKTRKLLFSIPEMGSKAAFREIRQEVREEVRENIKKARKRKY